MQTRRMCSAGKWGLRMCMARAGWGSVQTDMWVWAELLLNTGCIAGKDAEPKMIIMMEESGVFRRCGPDCV